MGKASKLTTLAAWALLAASCWWEAQEQKVSNFDSENTKSSLVETLSDEKSWDKAITWEDAKAIKNGELWVELSEIKEAIKSRELKKLVDYYGEEEVENRLMSMVRTISKNPSEYVYVNKKGEKKYTKKFKKLIKDRWYEYVNTNKDALQSTVLALLGIACALQAIEISALKEDNKGLKNRISDLECETKDLKRKYEDLEEEK